MWHQIRKGEITWHRMTSPIFLVWHFMVSRGGFRASGWCMYFEGGHCHRSNARIAHLNQLPNPPTIQNAKALIFFIVVKSVNRRALTSTSWSTKFPEFIAKESIVRNFRIYFVPAKRPSLVDDWKCPFSLSIIGPKWTVAGACPKLSFDNHGSYDSQRTYWGHHMMPHPLVTLHANCVYQLVRDKYD